MQAGLRAEPSSTVRWPGMSTCHPTLPLRPVLRFSTPDPRHPFYKDYHMACGHVLVHRPLKRGADGRYHVARRLGCPLCARLAAVA